MGNYVTKYVYNDNNMESIEPDIQPRMNEKTTEYIMHTPATAQKTLPVDPRSVTTGIDRTPIEVNSTPVGLSKRMISAIPKHLQMKPYLETDMDEVVFCLTPENSIPSLVETVKSEFSDVQNTKLMSSIEKERFEVLGIDPRSPAANFDRTPILKPKSMQRLRARYLQSLHKQGSYDTDLYHPTISSCEMSSQFVTVPEIQVLPDLATRLAKSLNFANANCNDSLNESNLSGSSHSSRTETISINDETSWENGNSKIVYIKKDKRENVCVNDDTVKVWRDSLASNCPEELELTEPVDAEIIEENVTKLPKEEVIITFDDDSIAKDTLSRKMFKSQTDKQKTELNAKKQKILKLEVKNVTDEKKIYNSDKNRGNEPMKIRTPLGNRSNNGQIQTILTKSPQQIYKNKNVTSKILQENTPPHKKYVAKSKLASTQWDPDSTIII